MCGVISRDLAVFRHLPQRLTAASALLILAGLSGCSSIASNAAEDMAGNLSTAILNQQDSELVRQGLPSYLLLLDSLVQSDPNDAELLGAAAELYAAFGSAFVADPERAKVLTARARQYGNRALCLASSGTCNLETKPFEEYEAAINGVRNTAAQALYSYCLANLAYIRANSDDWGALADLPKVEKALERLLAIGASQREANVNMFLGILNTLRPEALGGHPERGRVYFEKSIELSDGRDLSAKVEYARGYARLVYNRELHDQLLNQVLEAEVIQPGYTLFNEMARRQAIELLASADDYF